MVILFVCVKNADVLFFKIFFQAIFIQFELQKSRNVLQFFWGQFWHVTT